MDYFNTVSLDNTHCGIHLGAIFFSACTDIQILFSVAALGRNGMAQACACRLSPMLQVPNGRADVAHRYPTTQGTWTAQTTLSNILWHSAAFKPFSSFRFKATRCSQSWPSHLCPSYRPWQKKEAACIGCKHEAGTSVVYFGNNE